MVSMVRAFLAVQAVSFYAAALIHSGWAGPAHAHAKAATAETVIGTVLLLGLSTSLAAPTQTRRAGLFAQGFALLGTCVGIFTIAIGIGPRTPLDFVLHAGFIALLVTGLARVWREPSVPVVH
jgi:uncharacterized membrane protein